MSGALTLCDALQRRAEANPDTLFAEVHARGVVSRLTFSALYELAGRFGLAYRKHGVRAGMQVVTFIPHCLEQYPAYLGAMMIGAIPSFFTPLNLKSKPELYWNAQRALLEGIDPALIVTDRVGSSLMAEHLPTFASRLVALEDDDFADGAPPFGALPPDLSPIALVQYSSGTTGPRKGVALTHEAVLAQVDSYARALSLHSLDRIASWLPLYHDMGLIATFMLPLVTGVPVVALDPFEWVARPAILLDAIERFRATLCWLPNFAFAHLVNATPPDRSWDLASVRAFINCSEPCKGNTFSRFASRFGSMGVARENLHACYAIAENVFGITQTDTSLAVRTLGQIGDELSVSDTLSSGRPIDGVEVRICDDSREVLPDGVVGEVTIRSPFCIKEYFRSGTRAIDDEKWYSTGDLGVLVDGELYVIGRKDDMIVTRGKNILAHDVETHLAGIHGVKPGRCAALGVYSEKTETLELVLVIETTSPNIDVRSLRRIVSQSVEYQFGIAPTQIHFVPNGWILKTSSGKLSRKANVDRLKEWLSSGRASTK